MESREDSEEDVEARLNRMVLEVLQEAPRLNRYSLRYRLDILGAFDPWPMNHPLSRACVDLVLVGLEKRGVVVLKGRHVELVRPQGSGQNV